MAKRFGGIVWATVPHLNTRQLWIWGIGRRDRVLAIEGVEPLGIELKVLSPLVGSGARRVGLPALKSALPAQHFQPRPRPQPDPKLDDILPPNR
jgi:hypothetical protein